MLDSTPYMWSNAEGIIRNHAIAENNINHLQANRTLHEPLPPNDLYNKLAVIANDIYKT